MLKIGNVGKKTDINQQFEELEEKGYTAFRNFLDTGTPARIRAHIDSLLPPIAPHDNLAPELQSLLS